LIESALDHGRDFRRQLAAGRTGDRQSQGACQAFEDAYILGRWLDACSDPVEAFDGFRRVRIPRVHGVQRLSISNARFKHMHDSAARKESIASGKGSVHDNSDWVWGYDPNGDWNKEPSVPATYAA
jgi:salicylate hydroxylase